MGYEKKYKEALEKARELMSKGYYMLMPEIFPELREDERIRKIIRLALIASEDELSDFYKTHNIHRKECTDWLEKQKEQNPSEQKYEGKNLPDTVIAELGKYLGDNFFKAPWAIDSTGLQYPLYFANLGAKWQKEQKPAQTVDEKEYIRTIKGIIADFVRDKQPEDVAFYQKIYDWLDGRHIEQKPVEGKEYTSPDCGTSACCGDERFEIIAQAKRDIIEKTNIAENELSMELPLLDGILMRVWQVGWLNKQPAEWSEEDEKMLQHIISDLREFRDCETDEELISDYEDEIAWLKFLRPNLIQ